jgi:CIC family chloride channel protein
VRFIRGFFGALELHSFAKWILLASLVGVVAGLGAIAFDVLAQLVTRFSLSQFAGYVPQEAAGEHVRFRPADSGFSPWMIVVVMTCGGLVSGWLAQTFAPEVGGAGTGASIDAFHNRHGKIPGIVPLLKIVTSAVTLGTGGSGGREGPIAQIGAGVGSWLAGQLGLSNRERRILLATGMGAGVAAIFRAPLAGAVFAGEILYSDADLEADVIVPAAASSVVAYSVYTQSLPAETRYTPLFGSELNHLFGSPIEMIPYSFLAAVLTVVGLLYVSSLQRTRGLFEKLPVLPHFRPAIGACIAGLIAMLLWQCWGPDARVLGVLGTGYGTLQDAVIATGGFGIPLLLTIAIGKIATTALTIGSGGSGGVFGPSMVIGGCVGAAVGLMFQSIWPTVVTQPEAFAVVGMGGFFAGVARAPISTIIMMRAVTGDYELLLPTMLVSTITFFTCRRSRLYREQVPTRMDSKAHRGDFIVDVLEDLRVGDIFSPERKVVLIPEGMSLDDIVHCFAENQQRYFPVINDEGLMVGIFSDKDVRSYLYDDTLWDLAVAEDVMTSKVLSVTPEDNLNTALKRFTSLNLDELPVVDPDQPRKLLGMLRRRDTIAAYNQQLTKLKQTSE